MNEQAAPYVLYGTAMSLYSGKARSFLRKQASCDWVERSPAHPDYASRIQPELKRFVIPVLETPCGKIVQDTTEIIDYLENAGLMHGSCYPVGPRRKLVALLIEAFADESLLKQAMYYRWHFRAENGAFLSEQFAAMFGLGRGLPSNEAKKAAADAMDRMNATLEPMGVSDGTRSEIEQVYSEMLEILQVHLGEHPYLLGSRPTIADFGMMAPVFAHLSRDPHPASLMKKHGSRLYRWTERMNAPDLDTPEYLAPPSVDPDDDDSIPDTILPLLDVIAQTYRPEVEAIAQGVDEWCAKHNPEPFTTVTDQPHRRAIGMVDFMYKGAPMRSALRPYMLWMQQRICDAYAALTPDERSSVDTLFAAHNLSPLLTLKTSRRIERKGFLEVWGE